MDRMYSPESYSKPDCWEMFWDEEKAATTVRWGVTDLMVMHWNY